MLAIAGHKTSCTACCQGTLAAVAHRAAIDMKRCFILLCTCALRRYRKNNSEGGQPKWLPERQEQMESLQLQSCQGRDPKPSKYVQLTLQVFSVFFKASQPNSDCGPRTSRLAKPNLVLLSMASQWIPDTIHDHTRDNRYIMGTWNIPSACPESPILKSHIITPCLLWSWDVCIVSSPLAFHLPKWHTLQP